MKIVYLLLFILLALVGLGFFWPLCACIHEPSIDLNMVLVHTVQYGTMPFHTKGRGMVSRTGPDSRATVQVLTAFAQSLKLGHPASVMVVGVGGALTGKVTKIGALEREGAVPVELTFDQPLPPEVRGGDSADAVIEYGRIENTLYMERGTFNKENADVPVFRLAPDKKYAMRVTVHFGAIASEMIEIKSGLHEGDKVIVTDMDRWIENERIRIE